MRGCSVRSTYGRRIASELIGRHHHVKHSSTVAGRPTGSIAKDISAINRHRDFSPENESSSAVNARHLLRAILRECTYLPDPNARQYIKQHAISRFRTYEGKALKPRTVEEKGSFATRIKQKLQDGRHALHLLYRANQGELKPLMKVLYVTYGRIGKRKHELLAPLLIRPAQDGATASAEVDGLKHVESGEAEPARKRKESPLPPALYALGWSQRMGLVPELVTRMPRNLRPSIPEHNSKMRPMPQSRVKNLTKKWYADFLDRMLPPLPKDEWLELRDWANGRDVPMPPARRKAPHDMQSMAEPKGNALDMVVRRGSRNPYPKVFGNPLARNITRRSMQRLYTQVFRQCPLMELDHGTGKWTVSWYKDPVTESSSTEDISSDPESA